MRGAVKQRCRSGGRAVTSGECRFLEVWGAPRHWRIAQIQAMVPAMHADCILFRIDERWAICFRGVHPKRLTRAARWTWAHAVSHSPRMEGVSHCARGNESRVIVASALIYRRSESPQPKNRHEAPPQIQKLFNGRCIRVLHEPRRPYFRRGPKKQMHLKQRVSFGFLFAALEIPLNKTQLNPDGLLFSRNGRTARGH